MPWSVTHPWDRMQNPNRLILKHEGHKGHKGFKPKIIVFAFVHVVSFVFNLPKTLIKF
jgi:hypothetical protein